MNALRTHGRGLLADLVAAEPDMPVTPDLHAVGEEEWAALLTRVAAALAPDASCPEAAARTGTAARTGKAQ
jgi:hypothetical protein